MLDFAKLKIGDVVYVRADLAPPAERTVEHMQDGFATLTDTSANLTDLYMRGRLLVHQNDQVGGGIFYHSKIEALVAGRSCLLKRISEISKLLSEVCRGKQ